MAASKRSQVGFEDFPGEINTDKNLYEFPTLYKTAVNNKIRQWNIFIRLIKEDSRDVKETKQQNWNLLIEDEVPIKESYLLDQIRIPDGIIAELWTESGIMEMKISRSAATYILVPKNLGKKNERNVLQQAMIEARSKYLKKIDDGSVLTIKKTSGTIINNNTKFYPMLAKKFEDYENKIKYPVDVQGKLDGNRCVTFLDSSEPNSTYENVIMYSRSHKDFPYNSSNDTIRKSLVDVLKNNYHRFKSDTTNDESLFLDGELYKHGKSLQNINSVIKDTGVSKKSKSKVEINIQYWIYDLFYPSYTNEGFTFRYDLLKKIYASLDEEKKKNIILVETHTVNSREELDTLYQEYLEKGYEGIIIRTRDGPYLKSPTKKSEQLRSKDLLKRKEIFDAEFEVVDYKDGEGKEDGAVIWICITSDGKTFSVTPNMTYEERYEIYKECEKKFKKKYLGRMLTVEYRGLSDDGIPLQLKAKGFRL
jgi:ATP-dependent DNA ligase